MSKKDIPVYETEKEVFPTRLREIMALRGTNQTRLAKKIKDEYGITVQRQSISKYMNGQTKPDVDTITIICKALDVSADYLLGMTDIRSPDTDLRTICEYTGLSEAAVNLLRYFKESSNLDTWKGFVYTPISFIDKILSRPVGRGSWLVTMITSFCVACQHRYPRNNIPSHIKALEAFNYSSLPEGFTVVEKRDYSDYALHETERYFSKIIRGMADAAEKHLQLEMEAQNGIDKTADN